MRRKSRDIPFSRMRNISDSGIFVKHFGTGAKVTMKPYAHRDDYHIVAVLTKGSAAVEIDFERKELKAGDILIVSPWQIHNRPKGEIWDADGWIVAFSPETLSEAESRIIEEYSLSPRPFHPGASVAEDITALCGMLERNQHNPTIANALASAVKSYVLSSLHIQDNEVSDRYLNITLSLRKTLDRHLASEKSPRAYASMLNISEVYLNEAVKGATGLSTGAYIRERVIVRAKRLLACTSLTAKEIAYSLGYEDYAYFSKLFRKNVGKSPAEYRKNLK